MKDRLSVNWLYGFVSHEVDLYPAQARFSSPVSDPVGRYLFPDDERQASQPTSATTAVKRLGIRNVGRTRGIVWVIE